MHELSLAESVLQIIEETAVTKGFRQVRSVVLEIGQLATIEADAMRFCFDAVVRGSVAEGALLEIVEVPSCGWCAQCAETVPMSDLLSCCPNCGFHRLQLKGGQEMRLKSLEVE